jgi:transcriptional regulator with XRE-family HTH domain
VKGSTFRAERARRALSQAELAGRLGLQQSDISRIEHDILSFPEKRIPELQQLFAELDQEVKTEG